MSRLILRFSNVFSLILLLGACGSTDDADQRTNPTDAGRPEVSPDVDISETDETIPEPTPLPDDWCDRVESGMAETFAAPLALSQIHSQVRFFGVEGYRKSDRALVEAIGESQNTENMLKTYASELPSACHSEVGYSELPDTTVREQGSLAVLRPGRGSVSLDDSTETVVIDLRNLPAGSEMWSILRETVGPYLSEKLPRLNRRVRTHRGMVDEFYNPSENFSRSIETISKSSIAPSDSAQETQLVVRTGRRLSPEVAEFAITLKVAGVAHLVGRSIPTRIAESEWIGTQFGGVTFKARDLMKDGERVSNIISPDHKLAASAELSWEEWNSIIKTLPSTVEKPDGPSNRRRITPIRPVNNKPKSDTPAGTLRANLIILHAAVSRFYAYFESEKSSLNKRLKKLWKRYSRSNGSGQMSRAEVELAVRRLADELDERHAVVLDQAVDESSRLSNIEGFLGIMWEVINEEPVVRYTLYDKVDPGDRLVEIDGSPVEDVINKWRGLVSSNNDESEVRTALNRAKSRMESPYNAVFETPQGNRKSVKLEPVGTSAYQSLPDVDSTREAGWLDGDFSELYYVNLDESVSQSNPWSDVPSKLGEANGLVIDMRGYPKRFRHQNVLASLTNNSLEWLTYAEPTYRGPSPRNWDEQTRTIEGTASEEVAKLPVAVLIGIDTISAAENIVTPLWMHDRARFFGRPTQASNGTITGMWLPGKYTVGFTGLKVELPDGRSFHNTGIQPDERVVPTASDLASGNDRALKAAASWLHDQQN